MGKFNDYAVFVAIAIVVVVAFFIAKHGALDRSFDVKDDITGNVHSVTERSIETCKTMPHYEVVVLDGVERRCVQSQKWGATTILEK